MRRWTGHFLPLFVVGALAGTMACKVPAAQDAPLAGTDASAGTAVTEDGIITSTGTGDEGGGEPIQKFGSEGALAGTETESATDAGSGTDSGTGTAKGKSTGTDDGVTFEPTVVEIPEAVTSVREPRDDFNIFEVKLHVDAPGTRTVKGKASMKAKPIQVFGTNQCDFAVVIAVSEPGVDGVEVSVFYEGRDVQFDDGTFTYAIDLDDRAITEFKLIPMCQDIDVVGGKYFEIPAP